MMNTELKANFPFFPFFFSTKGEGPAIFTYHNNGKRSDYNMLCNNIAFHKEYVSVEINQLRVETKKKESLCVHKAS